MILFAEVAELVDALVSKINELYARAGSVGTKLVSGKKFLRILTHVKPILITYY